MWVSVQARVLDTSHDWKALRLSWYANALNPWAFNSVPRSLDDNKDFTLKDDMCANGDGKFFGQRYWYKGDPTAILLFDKNGIIAGIQTSVEKKQIRPERYSSQQILYR
jgi:hypothetical protein